MLVLQFSTIESNEIQMKPMPVLNELINYCQLNTLHWYVCGVHELKADHFSCNDITICRRCCDRNLYLCRVTVLWLAMRVCARDKWISESIENTLYQFKSINHCWFVTHMRNAQAPATSKHTLSFTYRSHFVMQTEPGMKNTTQDNRRWSLACRHSNKIKTDSEREVDEITLL